jgi:hypothetical protein
MKIRATIVSPETLRRLDAARRDLGFADAARLYAFSHCSEAHSR